MLTIDPIIARRFILGKQGLWPGRRWQGREGTGRAMVEMEYLQLDPLQIIARSHDITLHSRVLDYAPGGWEAVAYDARQFFDWGGWLATRPMAELPHWRVVMRRERDGDPDCDPRVRQMGVEHAGAIEEMRGILREQGTVGNRDFEAAARQRTDSYRGRKDSALALYYLWRTGEVMTHHREKFERIYALAEEVAPSELLHESEAEDSHRFLFKKEISFYGLCPLRRTSDAFQRGVPFSRKNELIDGLLAEGEIVPVKIDGRRPLHYLLAEDLPLLAELEAERMPAAWTPAGATTTEEAVFLAPLDPVCARGRAKELFDFDYVWEVYKPAAKRQYGYYVLPILWGERLVGRFDGKFDRESGVFAVLGFWLEENEEGLAANGEFAAALARGFGRFVKFLGANGVDGAGIEPPALRRQVLAHLG